MTVKEVMDKIKAEKERSEFLYQLSNKEQDEHTIDYLIDSSGLLDEYVEVLEQMKVQKNGV